MSYKRKYKPGAVLGLLSTVGAILAGRYVFWNDKPMHPRWMRSQHLGTLLEATARRTIREAICTQEVEVAR